MGVRYPGRAQIDPFAPQAIGICDRCGFQYNLRSLQWQQRWAGTNLINSNLLVCDRCLDIPNEQLRSIRLPPDPDPIMNARPENFAEAEKNYLNLRRLITKQSMFAASGEMTAQLEVRLGMVPVVSDTGDMAAALTAGLLMAPAIDGVGAMDAAATVGVSLTAAIDGVSDMTADLQQVSPVNRTFTDSFSFANTANTFTDTGSDIGAAVADRRVFVTGSGVVGSHAGGVDSMTIGGIAATKAVEIVSAVGANDHFSQIWWAAVPTGTTANIVLTFTGKTMFAGSAVYKVTGANTTTPVDSSNTASVSSGDVSAAITPPNSGATIATAQCGIQALAVPTITWTNITEDVEQSPNAGGSVVLVGAASRQDAVSPGSISPTASATTTTVPNKTLAVLTVKVP